MNPSHLFTLPHQDPWHTYPNSVFNLQRKEWIESVCLRDVDILGDTSLVTSRDRLLVEDVIDEALYWNPRPFPFHYLDNPDTARAIIEERKHCLSGTKDLYYKFFDFNAIDHHGVIGIYLCHPFGFYAYGHLHDSLQRLHSVRHLLSDQRYKFVVSRYDKVIDFFGHLSAFVGRDVSEDDIIQVAAKQIHRFEQLIVPFSPAMPTSFTPDTYEWAFTAYINKFVDEPFAQQNQRLYLCRNHISPGSRSVVNEQEIKRLLGEKGFIFLFGDEPLEEIVRHFYNAECIVGCHGSLFANVIFCRPGARVIEYCPSNRIDYSFKNKFKYVQDYSHLPVEADEAFNISIPIEDLLSRL